MLWNTFWKCFRITLYFKIWCDSDAEILTSYEILYPGYRGSWEIGISNSESHHILRYNLHWKKVYTWKLARYSKARGASLRPGFGQLHRDYDASPGIDLGPCYFEYSALFQVYTFFCWRLYKVILNHFKKVFSVIDILKYVLISDCIGGLI